MNSLPSNSRSSGHEPNSLPCELLVVDDEEFVREAMALFLESEGCLVHTAANGPQALDLADRHTIEAAIIDIRMPGMDGLTLLGELKSRHPDIEVLMATGFQSLETAVEAMRRGACDYITKPITDLENDLLRFVTRAIERRRLRLCNRRLSHDLQHALDQLGGVRGEWDRHLASLDSLESFGRRALSLGDIEALLGSAIELLPTLAEFSGATLLLSGLTDDPIVHRIGKRSEAHAVPDADCDRHETRWIDLKEEGQKCVAFPLRCPTSTPEDPVPGWLIVDPTPENPLRMVDRLVLRTFCDQLILSIAAVRGLLPRPTDPDAATAEPRPETENTGAP